MKNKTGLIIVVVIAALSVTAWGDSLDNDIAVFHCSMEDVANIESCNGELNRDPNFTEGSIGNGAIFSCIDTYDCQNLVFGVNYIDSEHGSISLSFKKEPNDLAGGIWQIGSHGDPNSLALFYNYNSNLYFEIKGTSSEPNLVFAPGVLSSDKFTHILATWDNRDEEDVCVIKLFINGEYGPNQSQRLKGTFNPEKRDLVMAYSSWLGHGQGIIDEVSFYDWALTDPEVYPEYIYSTDRFQKQEKTKPDPNPNAPVQILDDDMLLVNGEDFKIKGVGYQPLAIGMLNDEHNRRKVLTDPDIIKRDIAYIKNMNANTVRLWAEIPDANMLLLDELYAEGIYAILGIGIPHVDIDYADANDIKIKELLEKTENYINTYKDHPAVLAWAFGNEVDINYTGDLSDWYNLANKLAKKAYDIEGDQYHPTMIINAWTVYFGDKDYSSSDPNLEYVDMWGLNLYTRKDYHEFFSFYDKITAKPLVITEYGIDAYDNNAGTEYESVQAEWVVHEWQQIKENSCGGIVMEYCDEWWKGGDPAVQDPNGGYADTHPDNYSNEAYYGIMSVEKDKGGGLDIMKPREVYCALQQAFSERFCPADLIGDDVVNISDFAKLSQWWLYDGCFAQNCCGNGVDLNHDGTVDLPDMSIIAYYWLESIGP